MNKKLIAVLFMCLLYCVFIPSALAQRTPAENMPLDSLLNWVADHAQVLEDSTISYQYAHLSLQRAQAAQNKNAIAQAYSNLATWHNFNYHVFEEDSTIYYDLKALDEYKALGDQKKTGDSYYYLAFDYTARSKFDKATEAIFKGIDIFEKIKDQQRILDCYETLCDLYTLTKDTTAAVEYAEKSIDLRKKIPHETEELAYTYMVTTRAYYLKGDYKTVLQQCNDAIRIMRSKNLIDNNLMKFYNTRGDVYRMTGKYDAALKDYFYAWDNAKKWFGESIAAGYADNIGRVYQAQGKCQEAIPYFLTGLQYAIEFNVPYLLGQRYNELATCYKAVEDYKNALYYTELAHEVNDSTLNDKISNLEGELKIKYETAKKDETIATQKQRITTQRRIQWLTIGILALLGIVAIVIFFAYRNNKRITSQLEKKNTENELLLKEIHHRVKNNLQVISSLLSLQSAHVQDKTVLDAMRESQNRVRSMALIHQKLYQGENLAAVEMRDYFATLGESVLDSFGVASDKIQVKTPMEKMELDVDTAIPIGLIVNELVTNSMKYAFPDKQNGEIRISLTKESASQLRLVVADTGVGMDGSGVVESKSNGFGSQLVQLLTMQLNGKLETQHEKGMMTILRFETNKAA